MEMKYDIAIIGLGVMGRNFLLNMADHDFSCIGFDLVAEQKQALISAATAGTAVKAADDLSVLVQSLKLPRKIILLLPAGNIVDAAIENLLSLLDEGDIIVDSGNTYFEDTNRRVNYLKSKGIHFFGMGISGGEHGARFGPSLMPGGDKEAYNHLKPIFESVAAKTDGFPCVSYMGNGAAGHYVKMVHNGIEYAMMQMISEVYDFLKKGMKLSNEEIQKIFEEWNRGKLQSYLISITSEVLKKKDEKTGADMVDVILDYAGSKGTGKWTSEEALKLGVPIPCIDVAVSIRALSAYKEQRLKASELYGKEIVADDANLSITDIEQSLIFSFVIAYAQGLHLINKASHEYKMNIHLPSVLQVWKAGCIIRSSLLNNFSEAYKKDNKLENILLDADIAGMLQFNEIGVRGFVSTAVKNKIAVPSISAAIAYFDGFRSATLPVNLIQAQRDYFGAHTYQRNDEAGFFHTEWEQ